MGVTEDRIEYSISAHAKQRYAERIMGKEDVDVNRFVTLNEDKIKTDINKLIQYGDLIFTGKQTHKDGKSSMVDVYLKDCWIVLADSRIKNVITLYKIDLGLDDEFNKAYISKMMEKLNANKSVYILLTINHIIRKSVRERPFLICIIANIYSFVNRKIERIFGIYVCFLPRHVIYYMYT